MSDTKKTVDTQRHIQREQDRKDARPDEKSDSPSQADPAPKSYPKPPLPEQHQKKPGKESELDPAPRYEAANYIGSGKLEGKVAIITGGDSGIGRAVAVLFAREGANVAIVYLSEDRDAEQTQRAVEKEGAQCLCLRGDVKDPTFCRQVASKTLDEFGQINVLVNNAAFQEHADSLLDLTPERLDETFRTNIYGYIYMAQACLPHLSAGDSIINTSSVTALRGSAHLLDYSSTKGAIVALTYSLAENLAEQGIRVNAVAPGPVWTPLNPADGPAEKIPEFGAKTLFGRPAQPEELSPAYVYLASPVTASYVTGIVLPITGQGGF
ncbi:MAG: SDR family oxidoreductase [Pigmentiphaga sp.]